MMSKQAGYTVSKMFFTLLAIALLINVVPVFGGDQNFQVKRGAIVHPMVHSDLSLPLRDIPPAPRNAGVRRVVPNRPIPIDVDNNAPISGGGLDSVIQMSPGTNLAPNP